MESGAQDRKAGLLRFQSAGTRRLEAVRDSRLADAVRVTTSALDHAQRWLSKAETAGQPELEAGARRFAMTLGRTMELALLIEQAQWSEDHERDGQAIAAARRFAEAGVNLIHRLHG